MTPRTVRQRAGTAALLACAAAADAQGPPLRQVSVDLSGVASDIATRMTLDESVMPLSVLVPTDVAAEACQVPVKALVAAGCTARVASERLGRLLASRMRSDEPPAPRTSADPAEPAEPADPPPGAPSAPRR